MGARHALQIGVLLIGSLAVAVAADPPAPPTAERDRLRRRAEDLAGRGEAAAAVKAAEEALALDRAAFGANSAATADGLEVLARVRERNEQWAQAAAARREAARILAGLYGPADWRATDARFAAADTDRRAARSAAARRDEEAATALNREVLAALDRGEPAAALGPARRALLIRLRVLGPDHPNTLVSLNNLSRVYEDAGDRDEAEAVCRRALRGRERVLGPNHPHVAVSLHNLALLVAARGASDEAVRLLTRVIAIDTAVYGADHSETVFDRNTLAGLLVRSGRDAEAADLFGEVLAAREKVPGKDHPQTAQTLSELAELALRAGNTADAERYASRALAIREAVLGKDHPATADSLRQLARIHVKTGDAKKAEPLLTRALGVLKAKLGELHPEYARCLSEMATVAEALGRREDAVNHHFWAATKHESAGRRDEAEAGYRAMLRIKEADPNRRTPDVNYTRERLASLLGRDGRNAEALRLREANVRAAREGGTASDRGLALEDLARTRLDAGQYDQAEAELKEAIDICRRAGDDHRVFNELTMLGWAYERGGRIPEWLACKRELDLRLGRRVWERPEVAGLISVAVLFYPLVRGTDGMLGDRLGRPLYEVAWRRLAVEERAGDFPAARRAAIDVLAVQRALYGPGGQPAADTLLRCGHLALWDGDFATARAAFDHARSESARLFGADHPRTADARRGLADVARWEKLSAADLRSLRTAVAARERADHTGEGRHFFGFGGQNRPLEYAAGVFATVLGPGHPDTADAYHRLAVGCIDDGNLVGAEWHLRKAAAGRRASLGPGDPRTVAAVRDAGLVALAAGDLRSAEARLEQALAAADRLPGGHPERVKCLAARGRAYQAAGDAARAERALLQAVSAGPELTDAHALSVEPVAALADLHFEAGDFASAIPLLRRALFARWNRFGRATTRANEVEARLAVAEWATGRRTAENAAGTLSVLLGKYNSGNGYDHPERLRLLQLQTVVYLSAGRFEAAADSASRSARLAHRLYTAAAGGQSERQQLAFAGHLRTSLDHLLSVVPGAGLPDVDPYQVLLNWKGTVAVRQRRVREFQSALKANPDPSAAAKFDRLRAVSEEIAAAAFAGQSDRVVGLSRERDELEADLARLVDARPVTAPALTPDDVQRLLPPDAALIDLYEYQHLTPAPEGRGQPRVERRVVGFVVRRDRDVVRVDLGPAAAIAAAVEDWRAAHGREPAPAAPALGERLRRLVWDPLAPHLGDARTVLVSPDGRLTGAPWAALPAGPGRWLIDDYTFVNVPVPQLLVARRPAAGAGGSLLVVGGVDFDAVPAAAPATENDLPPVARFGMLPGTRAEAEAVRRLHAVTFPGEPAVALTRDAATKPEFLRAAPAARYVHLATHGFFATPDDRGPGVAARAARTGFEPAPQATVWTPGLASGVVFAGVNRLPRADVGAAVLTASEVRETDLAGAELVVLSACETGLGEVAGGEGVLGLQRALHVAGAKAVVSSLWKVDDAATEALMGEFYRNLWVRRLPRAEALRQAQLWLARGDTTDPAWAAVVGAPAAVAVPGPARGVVRPTTAGGRRHPYYWAAFVLSGDWH